MQTFRLDPNPSIRELEAEIELLEEMAEEKPVFRSFYKECAEELEDWLKEATEERDKLLR